MKLSVQLLILVLIPVLIFGVTFQISFSTLIKDQIISSHISEVNSLTIFATKELKNPLYFKDIDGVTEIIDNLKEHPNVFNVHILFPDGRVFADGTNSNVHYNQVMENEFIFSSIQQPAGVIEVSDDRINVLEPIIVGKTIGYLHFDYNLLPVHITFLNLNTLLLIVAIASAGISISVGQILKNRISNPIEKIKQISQEIAQGKFSEHDKVSGPEEIQSLSYSILEMAERLEKLQTDIIKQERLSSIGQISARINHDLRNPLNVLSNSVDLIEARGTNLDPNLKKYLPIMKDSIERMNHQINQVLGHVKLKPIQLQHVESRKLFDDAISLAHVPQNISLELPSTKSLLYCDPNLLSVVITNILSNAVHAIGEKNGIISISLTEIQDHMIIEIEDSGNGISDENLDLIFEPLFTTKQKGTGLGLVTCKTIVEQHGGTISAKNSSNGGALFSITIPKKIEI